ncbi:MAG: hypothetical protein GX294_08920 [Candidatus Cloacimonetes bacterium]|nr:hypothetical protein [Candidatus Cloacimonadota bacterium]
MKRTIFIVLLLVLGTSILAQTESPSAPVGGISAYSYDGARAGVEKLKMNVYILGQIYRPGLYVVPDDTNFITLLALAGGPKEDAKLTKIRIIRPKGEGNEPEILWVNLKKYMDTADESLLPVMMPGDTVILSGTIFYAFSKVVDFLSKVAIALSVYNIIVRL